MRHNRDMTRPKPKPNLSADWATVPKAAEAIGRDKSRVHAWLRLPAATTGIRQMRPGAVTLVHLPTLKAYEATVRPGRPPAAK